MTTPIPTPIAMRVKHVGRLLLYCGLALCGFSAAGLAMSVGADDTTAKSPEHAAKEKAKAEKPQAEKTKPEKPNLPPFSEEREAAALTFVREHHPEVADLLARLKSNRPGQYRKAIRELSQQNQRLAQWKDRDPARYELELRLWKLQSKVQLLSARATMSGSVVEETELRQVLAEQMDVRIALIKLQRDTAARRVQELEGQIVRLTAGRDSTIDRQITRAKQAIEQQRKRKKIPSGTP
jgi:hypothetical protein